ncbi:MAG TPA: diacylglycerol kinase family protein, partial [Vicinamibacterales bacterium]|nr:diacylglycerol kinase family protein [Vicinamibacterales bacterium]
TAFEVINGLFPEALEGPRPRLGLLPLGTGNSFLRDFGPGTVEHALEAIAAGRARACDVNEVRHEAGVVYSMNLVSLGFVADVAVTASRGFKRLGAAGYLLAVGAELARLEPRAFPLRHDDEPALDRRRCLFLSFNNSRFTGGSMLIAPHADPADGLIECVRWDPVGRLRLVWNLPTLFTGAHIRHPRASRRAARRVEFALDGPVDVMIDGEVLRLACRSIEVRPAAIDVLA